MSHSTLLEKKPQREREREKEKEKKLQQNREAHFVRGLCMVFVLKNIINKNK